MTTQTHFPPTRLEAMRLLLGTLARLALVVTVPLGAMGAIPSAGGVSVTHGPYVSAVTESSAIVFVRVSGAALVWIVYSPDPTFGGNALRSAVHSATADSDFTVRIPLAGLQPETVYFYKVMINGKAQALSVAPRFRTAPTPDSLTDFRFAVFSDAARWEGMRAMAYRAAAKDNPDFALQIGDLDHRDPGLQPLPIAIDNWRVMHRDMLHDYAAGQDLANAILPYTPFYHVWDDHDYGANNADRTAPWKAAATRAFKEYFPLPALPNPSGGLWYSFRFAQAEIFMLDLRSQRDPNDDPDGPGKSMLDGAVIPNGQKEWLKSALLASAARWKLVVSSSVWNPNSKQVDSWYLFQNEQRELVQFIRDNGIQGVIILSGDLHTGGAIDDGTNSYFPEVSVPTTNVVMQEDCTGGYCGSWSEGLIGGSVGNGYALITILHDDASGADRAVLQVKGEAGDLRLQYVTPWQ